MNSKPLVIITGASSGLGAAMAQVFSNAGYPLGLIARNLQAMQDLKLPNALCQSVDVTDFDAMKKAIDIAQDKFGPVDCLINNAGDAKSGDFIDISHEHHERMVRVNIMGVMHGIETVLPKMRERKTGTIINISSLADRNSRPQLAIYAATKAAVKSLSESLRMANAKYGIRICNLAPAKILTPMTITTHLTSNQMIDPQDFAKTALWIYQQPQTVCVRDLVLAPTYYEA